jgi:hypothetical protein
MKRNKITLVCFIVIALFGAGCSNSVDNENSNIEDIVLKEAKRITFEQGYSLKSESLIEPGILIGDARVSELIKDASIECGYSEDDFNLMTEHRKVVGYELEEKSKFHSQPVMLCFVVDSGEVIGAYLDYEGYIPGIAPIDYKDDFE